MIFKIDCICFSEFLEDLVCCWVYVLMLSPILASFQGSLLFAGKSLGMRLLSHQQPLARCWVYHSTYVVTSRVLVTLYSQCNLIPIFFTVALCNNSGVDVRIVATEYIKAAVLWKMDIFERNSLFSEMACATSDQRTSNDVPLAALYEKLCLVQK